MAIRYRNKDGWPCAVDGDPFVTLDKYGEDVYAGDVVSHNNNIRPKGMFKVAWDQAKVGWVLLGVSKDEAGWLKDWSAEHIELIKEAADED